MIATETPTCIISAKIVTHIFDVEILTGISFAEDKIVLVLLV